MKKLLLFTFLSSFFFISCVDKDFDLGKINDSGITFGDEFVAPIGSVEINISDVIELPRKSRANIKTVRLPETFERTFNLGGGFDEGIADALSDLGSQTVEAVVTHPLPDVRLTLNISFFNGQEETKVIENKELDSKDRKTNISVDIIKDIVTKISSCDKMLIKFNVIEGANQDITIDFDSKIYIDLKLKIKGGLKLK